MKILNTAVLLATLLASSAHADEDVAKELVPTGKLRVGLVFAPSAGAFFVTKEADGKPRGVTADLGTALGQQLKVPVEFILFPNSGGATDATESGAVDVSFMPIDEERKNRRRVWPDICRG